jgi:type IV secretion system protein VirB9
MGTRSTSKSVRNAGHATRPRRRGALLVAAALPFAAAADAHAQATASARTAPPRRESRSDLATVNAGTTDRGIVVGNAAVYAFGRSQPVVTCTVLRACIVELEPGEVVVDEPIAGDQVRWHISASRAGPAGGTVLVVVKPQFCDITTNLVVPTDRRIYDLTLDSPPCAGGSRYNPQQAYVRHVRFTYDGTRRLDAAAVTAGSNAPLTRTSSDGGLKLPRDSASAALNRDYRIVRTRRGLFGVFTRRPIDFPWRPVAAFDDGAHLTIELPAAARHQAAPALYALEDDGSRTLMNYSARWDAAGTGRYVTDRVARRVVLVLRSGRREQTLALENRSYTAPRPVPTAPAALIPGYTGRAP